MRIKQTMTMLLLAGAVVLTSAGCKKSYSSSEENYAKTTTILRSDEPSLAIVQNDIQKILEELQNRPSKHPSIQDNLDYLTQITGDEFDVSHMDIDISQRISEDALLFIEALNDYTYEGEQNKEEYLHSLTELLNNSSVAKNSYEYELLSLVIDVTSSITFTYFWDQSIAKLGGWRCSAGIIGGAIGGFIQGALVGTVSVPGIGTVSGAPVGAVGGAFWGATMFC